jgi:hypothetical protein
MSQIRNSRLPEIRNPNIEIRNDCFAEIRISNIETRNKRGKARNSNIEIRNKLSCKCSFKFEIQISKFETNSNKAMT